MVIGNDGLGLPQQLMADETVRLLGPLRGVLPIGPDGFRGFNTLNGWDRSSSDSTSEVDVSYSLIQQGLESEVKCAYDHESPIHYGEDADGPYSSGTCDSSKGLKSVLPFDAYPIPDPNEVWSLTSWGCRGDQPSPTGATESDTETYILYLRGTMGYVTSIGNITCTLSKLRFRDYNVTYTESGGYFTTQNATTSPEIGRNSTESFLNDLVTVIGDMIWGTQTRSGHVVAESILDTGERLFNVPTNTTNDRHLRLFEGFTQGALEYYVSTPAYLVIRKTVF
jgi:hypothetical protein